MHILLLALGTRGDVQPSLALGRALQARGHAVRVLAGSNFESWIRGYGLDFAPMLDMEALMQSEGGSQWLNSRGFGQLRAMNRLMFQHQDAMIEPIHAAVPQADVILPSFVATPFAFNAAEKFGKQIIPVFLQPFAASEYPNSHMAANIPFRSPLNRAAAWVSERILYQFAHPYTSEQRRRLGLPPLSARAYYARAYQLTGLVAVSRHVVPPPPDAPPTLHTVGYWFLDEGDSYTPDPALLDFLNAGAPPVYIGFGSMADPTPEQTPAMLIEAARATGARVLLGAGWSAWGDQHQSDDVFIIKGAPHDWLFPRVAAVVHHGGSGTTAAGLRAGKPTFIIAHIADQPYWGKRVEQLGVGPRAVARQRLTRDALISGIRSIMHDAAMQERAASLGERIRAEDGIGEAVRVIESAR